MEFLVLAASVFGLGALHALEPGHGKTVVGAYLVGSKGHVRDAVLLGLIVTLTHSGGVIVLGILSVMAAAYLVPETVQKVLEVVSALLIVGVGGWMLAVRIRALRAHGPHAHIHPHDHAHEHPHEHHYGGHDHDGDPHPQVPPVGERASLGQLIALGVSGGIVPCPAALAVLLAAVGMAQFARGLLLVIVFSLGMAAVLVAIGIMMVKAADVAGKYVSEGRWTKIVPVVSAALILLIGIGLTIKALVDVL